MQTSHGEEPSAKRSVSVGHGERMASIAVGSGRLRSGLKERAPASVNLSELSEGYSLLYDLLSKEKHSNLLWIIKQESPEFFARYQRS